MPTLPSGADPEVTFLSGLTADGKIAAKSFWTWISTAAKAGTYDSAKSSAFKWGPSQAPGSSGGTVKYFCDPASNWTSAEKAALAGGLHLWAAEANIQFTEVSSLAAADFQFIRGNDKQADQRRRRQRHARRRRRQRYRRLQRQDPLRERYA